MFPLYLQYLLIDFRQTFVTGASWDTDDLITFLGQKVIVQRHTIAAEAHSTRRYRRVQLFSSLSVITYIVHLKASWAGLICLTLPRLEPPKTNQRPAGFCFLSCVTDGTLAISQSAKTGSGNTLLLRLNRVLINSRVIFCMHRVELLECFSSTSRKILFHVSVFFFFSFLSVV